MDRLTELAREREELRGKLEKVEAEMLRELGGGRTAVATPPRRNTAPTRPAATRQPARPAARPQPAAPTRREQASPPPRPAVADAPTVEAQVDGAPAEEQQEETVTTPRTNGESNGEGRQPSLKDVILNQVLANSRTGMELKEIVAEITRMIQNGEYNTKAKKVTPIVSQALHQLKAERLVSVEKSAVPPHRNLYSLGETA
jgi:hypothetical protein